MKNPYEDMISMPYPRPSSRPRMSMQDRAAQFSPFAALVGYEASLAETARRTSEKIELSEDAKKELNDALVAILENRELCAEITYFLPDDWKKGGTYVTVRGKVTRLDSVYRVVTLDTGAEIWIEDMVSVSICNG